MHYFDGQKTVEYKICHSVTSIQNLKVVLPNLTFQLWSYVITPQHRGKTGQQQRDNRRGTSLFPHKSVVKPGT